MDPDKTIHTKLVPTCISCGGIGNMLYSELSDRLYQVPGKWNIFVCPNCGMAWINPSPLEEDISNLYESYYTHQAGSINSFNKRTGLGTIIQTAPVLKRFVLFILKIAGVSPLRTPSLWKDFWIKRGLSSKILDVGCGNGDFLEILKALDWEIYGIEPDSQAAAVATGRLGIQVHNQILESAGFPDNYFDVIFMNQVIEHLANPTRTIQECFRILKPGGKLLVSTPNIQSLGHQYFKQAWIHLDPPRHICIFSIKALRRMIEQTEFSIESLKTTSSGAKFTWLASWVIKQNGTLNRNWRASIPLSVHMQSFLFQTLQDFTDLIANSSENIEVVATKNLE